MNPYYDPKQPHHRPEGFQNLHEDFVPKSLAEVLRWKWDAARHGVPKPPLTPTPRVVADIRFLQANALAGDAMVPTVTWIGHASVMVQLGGITLLTDPIFSERASPLPFLGPKRHLPPGVAPADLPHVDLVLVSHNHYDHLDALSVETLDAQPGGPPVFIVPLGLKPWLAGRGLRSGIELDWWQTHRLPTARGGST